MDQIDDNNVLRIIENILQTLDIKHVVFVDDVYALDDKGPIIIGWLAEAIAASKQDVVTQYLPDISLDSPEEVWKDRFTKFWGSTNDDDKENIFFGLSEGLEIKEFESEKGTLTTLEAIIPKPINFMPLSPSEWVSKEEEILSALEGDERILIIFDRNLSSAEGYAENSGIELLIKIVKEREVKKLLPKIVVGLLTRTVSEATEIEESLNISAQYNLNISEFLLLAKERLTPNPLNFTEGLKKLLLNHVRLILANKLFDLSVDASTDANKNLRNVDVSDFDYIVLQSSEKEGVWEAETLFRFFELFRLQSFREKALSPPSRDFINEKISKIREIRDIDTTINIDQHQSPIERIKIRRIELYEDPDLLNRAHMPIELGDIFEIIGTKYVLVGQPCDLIIREDGKRALEAFTLLKVSVPEEQEKKLDPRFNFEITYFELDSGHNGYAKFKFHQTISLDILDMAVFHEDGGCRIDLSSNPPVILHKPWLKRYETIKCKLSDQVSRFEEITKVINNADLSSETIDFTKQSLIREMTRCDLDISLEINDNKIEFNIKRVGRIKLINATRLLNNYVSFLARDAEEHDFV